MGKINWGRVFLGGLLAGVVVNVFEFVTNGLVLASNWAWYWDSLWASLRSGFTRPLAHGMAPVLELQCWSVSVTG